MSQIGCGRRHQRIRRCLTAVGIYCRAALWWEGNITGSSVCSHCSTAMSGFMKITHRRSLHLIYTHRFIYKLLCIQPWAIHSTSVEQYMLNTTMHTVQYIMHVIDQVHLQRTIETYNCILWVTANSWSYRIVSIANHHCIIDRRYIKHTHIQSFNV